MFFRLNLPLNKFRRQCYDGAGNMSGQRTGVANRIQELEPGQSNHILKATRWMWQRAACWSKAPCLKMRCRHHKKTSNLYRIRPKNKIYSVEWRRTYQATVAESVFEPCAIADGPIKVDALGSIIRNCKILQSTWDDAKDVDLARYCDEGKNSRCFVSNKQIPLSVRDHIWRTTAETRQQLELNYAAHVASATKFNN